MVRALERFGFVLALVLSGCGSDEGGGSGDGGSGECGNGIVEEPEECDNGIQNSDTEANRCRTTCLLPACGDGVLDRDEDCDDGAANSDTTADACRTTCEEPSCGDGVIDDGESCDDGEDNSDFEADACRRDCEEASCGDGVEDSDEECDDGDDIDGNECSNDCTIVILWTETISDAFGNGIAVHTDDSFVVVGDDVSGDDSHIWVRKYTAGGATAWTETYDGAANDDDSGRGVAIDSAGNVIVCGAETTADGDVDAVIRKYDSTGAEVWTRNHDGALTPPGDDWAVRVVVDSSDNVLVVGVETTETAGRDIWVRKYDPAGSELWTRTYDGVGGHDEGEGIAVDSSDNVLVAGMEAAGLGAENGWVRKYDSAGSELWTRTYVPAEGFQASANGVTVDSSDNPVIAGAESDGEGSFDIFVRKYDPAGTALWTESYDGAANDFDSATDVATHSDDDILVTGVEVADTSEATDAWTARYDSSGSLTWNRSYADQTGSFDGGRGIRADSAGNVLVVGYVLTMSSTELWVAKYVP